MKMTVLKFTLSLLLLISACETEKVKIEETTTVKGNGKPLNLTNTPKIGAEFELSFPFFKFEKDLSHHYFFKKKKYSYFEVGEKVYEHKSGLISIDADYSYKLGYSDFEINTKPIDFTKAGLNQFEEACQISSDCFKKIYIKSRGVKGIEGEHILTYCINKSKVETQIGNTLLKNIQTKDIKKFSIAIDESLGFTKDINDTKSYLFTASNDAYIVPQITFPMSFKAIYRFLKLTKEGEEREAITHVLPSSTIKASSQFIRKIESDYLKDILTEKNDNETLKGFIGLIYLNLYKFHKDIISDRNLKNNTPILKTRNDFATLFQTLPEESKDFLAKNNAKNLLEIISRLEISSDLEKPIFEKSITLKFLRQERKIIQELSIKNWLIHITRGTDLLVKENYNKHFFNTPEEEINELGYAGFGDFGKKTESVNGQAAGIYEWRVHPSFHFSKTQKLKNYVMAVARLMYKLNEIKE